jgi:hypothetical protein
LGEQRPHDATNLNVINNRSCQWVEGGEAKPNLDHILSPNGAPVKKVSHGLSRLIVKHFG